MLSVHFQGKTFNITVIQDYAPTNNAEEVEVKRFYEDVQELLELTPKRCPFHHRGLECKSRSQEIPGVIVKFVLGVQNEAEQRLTVVSREHAGHSKHPFPITQEITLHMDVTR